MPENIAVFKNVSIAGFSIDIVVTIVRPWVFDSHASVRLPVCCRWNEARCFPRWCSVLGDNPGSHIGLFSLVSFLTDNRVLASFGNVLVNLVIHVDCGYIIHLHLFLSDHIWSNNCQKSDCRAAESSVKTVFLFALTFIVWHFFEHIILFIFHLKAINFAIMVDSRVSLVILFFLVRTSHSNCWHWFQRWVA
jgi:hypothetical protein